MSPSSKPRNVPSSETSDLAQRLVTLGYVELFHRLDDDALNSIWGQPGAPQALEKLALDPEASTLARFLAAEVLFYKRRGYPPEEAKGRLAPIYSAALSQNFPGITNTWGLPGELDGLAGQHFVALGEAAIAELVKLLNDETGMIYSGSKDATFGNSYRYRVKDLAAFYISKTRGIPYDVHLEPKARDREIRKLQN